MNLSGKKLTTAILAGLMGATVAGISVVGAAGKTIIPQIPRSGAIRFHPLHKKHKNKNISLPMPYYTK